MEPDGFTCPVPCAMAENEVQAEESSVPCPAGFMLGALAEAKEEVQAKEKFGPCMMCGMEEGGHTSLCVFQEEAKQLGSHFINQVLDSRQGKFLNSGWRTKEFYVPVCKECYKRARRPAQASAAEDHEDEEVLLKAIMASLEDFDESQVKAASLEEFDEDAELEKAIRLSQVEY